LVNNAGIYQFSPIETFSEDSFHQQFNTNVLGSLLTISEAVKQFDEKGGVIINISSGASTTPLL
jgi:3-oxoacyl-[acyl-carrier protein] reductase